MRFLLARIMTPPPPPPQSHPGQKIHRQIWRAARVKSPFQRTYEPRKKLERTLGKSNLTFICWEIDNFVIKSDIFRRYFIC